MFVWNDEATRSFTELKEHVVQSPFLIYQEFTKLFVLETNACIIGIGTVLMQNMHPMAYYSNKILGRALQASTYTKIYWVSDL